VYVATAATPSLDEYSWSTLFGPLETPTEPQTTGWPRLPPIPGRTVEDLAKTAWHVVEVHSDGLVLRDGPGDRWSEETFWMQGCTPGRSYGIRFEDKEFEFAKVLTVRKAICSRQASPIAGETIITRSFNFTKAADDRKVENLVMIRNRGLARLYTDKWEARQTHSQRS
jgi:hypothetical protein